MTFEGNHIMLSALAMSHETLEELVFALRTSVLRVQLEELASSTARDQWLEIRRWVEEAEIICHADTETSRFTRLKSFPISGAELNALQAAVDRAAESSTRGLPSPESKVAEQLHQADIARPYETLSTRLHKGLRRVHTSSIALVVTIFATLVANLWALIDSSYIPRIALISGNIVFLGLALVMWISLQRQIRQHTHLIHWHFPIPFVHFRS